MTLLLIITSFLSAALISALTKQRGVIEFFAIAASLIACAGSLAIALGVAASGTYAPLPFLSVDALGAIVILIVACVGLAATAYSIAYLREEMAKNILGFARIKQYFILSNLFLAAIYLAATASNPIFAWVFLEATTLSTAFLISFYNKPSAIEAAWKYLIINSIGLLLAFFGTLLYFTAEASSAGSGLMDWQSLATSATHLDPIIAKIAFIFVIIGYGTKVGFAPMHTWKPDAYSKAPAPLGALFSGALLPVAFSIVLKFKAITNIAIGPLFGEHMLIVFGTLSIAIATFIILVSKDYKRLLAYSSIENAGIMALGFGFGGLGIFGALLHMVYHSLIKSALFFTSGNILLKYHSAKIEKVQGALTALPVTSILFLIGFFSIVGAPPFGILFTKIFIFSAGIGSYPIVSIGAIFLTAILFIGFFKHASAMVFGEKPSDIQPGEGSVWLTLPSFVLIAIALILSFYIPPFIYTLINNVIAHY